MEHSFTWVSLIPGLNQLPVHTAHATIVAVGLLAWAWAARRQIATATDPIVPDATLTLRNSLEVFVEWFVGFIEGLLGHGGRKYLHVYATFFLFILMANLMGLVPGFAPPTSNFNITFALGVASFLVYNYYGMREKGVVEYLKHFMGPIWWLAVLMLPLELIDNFVRPLSLGLRLFGNMTGDHLVLEIFTDLTKVVIPVIFYMLGAFVSLIQAFVFTILSVIYLSLAIADHGHHEEEHAHH
ncbi:MAG TPA: F0F1 ATP synthase subunit A [Candidatus Acidoferrales bacterium]|nr:F0F1 ATP synthase subunit A [Candidatus Acidoferrales bacterium]